MFWKIKIGFNLLQKKLFHVRIHLMPIYIYNVCNVRSTHFSTWTSMIRVTCIVNVVSWCWSKMSLLVVKFRFKCWKKCCRSWPTFMVHVTTHIYKSRTLDSDTEPNIYHKWPYYKRKRSPTCTLLTFAWYV